MPGTIRFGVAPIAWKDPVMAPPYEYALKGRERLERAFTRAGFTIAD
jgi:hypothetical protein